MASCSDPIECGHEAALGQLREENARLSALINQAAGAIGKSVLQKLAMVAKESAPLHVTATGFGATFDPRTGQVVLDIDTDGRSIHIDLGTEFAEPMGALLLNDPAHSDGCDHDAEEVSADE